MGVCGSFHFKQLPDINAKTHDFAALVSLKTETPGSFMGAREDVPAYIGEFY